jgi:hypothetical protein
LHHIFDGDHCSYFSLWHYICKKYWISSLALQFNNLKRKVREKITSRALPTGCTSTTTATFLPCAIGHSLGEGPVSKQEVSNTKQKISSNT